MPALESNRDVQKTQQSACRRGELHSQFFLNGVQRAVKSVANGLTAYDRLFHRYRRDAPRFGAWFATCFLRNTLPVIGLRPIVDFVKKNTNTAAGYVDRLFSQDYYYGSARLAAE